jgi:hypothetical protein
MKTSPLPLALSLLLGSAAFSQTPPQRQPPPPENAEISAAGRIQDASARLKAFQDIKAKYPATILMAQVDRAILMTRVELAESLDAVLALQKEMVAGAQCTARLSAILTAATQIVGHAKLATFAKPAVVEAVVGCKAEAAKLVADPAITKDIPAERLGDFRATFTAGFAVPLAKAHLNAGDAAKALTALEAFLTDGGSANAAYYATLGDVNAGLDKSKEAFEAYLAAAVETGRPADVEKAKGAYGKVYGKEAPKPAAKGRPAKVETFEAMLEARQIQIPFHPEAFKPSPDWKGKVALAEIFTGSECPPCVGADFAFDGLLESYPTQYLAVLEYHLPIPRPDPIMNGATGKRQAFYGVNSTPTAVFEGEKKITGGGGRGAAAERFKTYRTEIDARINAAPAVALKATATFVPAPKVKATKAKVAEVGDLVKVDCGFDKVVPGAEYHAVLVQKEERYKGSNGIMIHKMVVRDLVTLDPAGTKQVTFDLAASEQAADAYLTEFENTTTRFKDFKFPERHAKIARTGLRVVFFAQDKESKKVLNAVVADVTEPAKGAAKAPAKAKK